MGRRKTLKLSSPAEVRHALSRIANMVMNDELDPQRGNTIVGICNAVLSSIRTDELQRRVDETEKSMEDKK